LVVTIISATFFATQAMQIKFYLETNKTTRHGDSPVYMYITYEGKRIRKPVSGVHVKEKNWDKVKERIRRPPKANPFDEIESFNNRLDFIETQIKLINQTAFDRRTRLTENYILDRLNDESLLKTDQFDFFNASTQYLESIKPVKAARTITNKTTVFNFLKEFQKATSYELTFHQMNIEFFDALRKYAFEKRKIGDNYFAKIIAVLKTFLNWAYERDYIKHQEFKKFKASERETEIICLTLEEFLALYKHKFKSNRLARVRDVFIFGCSTGLRFSDLISILPSDIQGEFIVKNIQKTQENSMIPLNKYSKDILKNYENTVHEILPKVSHQKFNQYLKECCKEVGIDTPISITKFSGSKRKHSVHPKYELITSHTARKTFTTLSLLMGVPERVVKNITGHKKEENFKRYVNFTKEYEKKQMDDVWDKI
jgi:integrase